MILVSDIILEYWFLLPGSILIAYSYLSINSPATLKDKVPASIRIGILLYVLYTILISIAVLIYDLCFFLGV